MSAPAEDRPALRLGAVFGDAGRAFARAPLTLAAAALLASVVGAGLFAVNQWVLTAEGLAPEVSISLELPMNLVSACLAELLWLGLTWLSLC